MRSLVKTLLVLCSFLFCFSVATVWDQYNNPQNLVGVTNYFLQQLPTFGSLNLVPWSDSYWPSNMGGIAQRWYTNSPQGFGYRLYSLSTLKTMPLDALRSLSPAEKYDIYMRRYDYPTVKSEWSRVNPNDLGWEGLCHGWAAAAYYFAQPNPVVLTNPDGIKIPFGSSDTKALLTYYLGQYVEPRALESFIGQACHNPQGNPLSQGCADVNPGSLHIAVANLLGLKKKGFIFDRSTTDQVWNQPAYNYSIRIFGTGNPVSGSAPGTASEVRVRMYLTYTDETYPKWTPSTPIFATQVYDYLLDVDRSGKILGGGYVYPNRPDFLWTVSYDMTFTGYFSSLRDIYSASIGVSSDTLPPPRLHKAPGYPYVVEMTTNKGKLVSEAGPKGLYPNNLFQAWSIKPTGANAIIFTFPVFLTERNTDVVKIYEGESGDGALIASLSGSKELGQIPDQVVVQGSSAYVVFSTSPYGQGQGFVAEYNSA